MVELQTTFSFNPEISVVVNIVHTTLISDHTKPTKHEDNQLNDRTRWYRMRKIFPNDYFSAFLKNQRCWGQLCLYTVIIFQTKKNTGGQITKYQFEFGMYVKTVNSNNFEIFQNCMQLN